MTAKARILKAAATEPAAPNTTGNNHGQRPSYATAPNAAHGWFRSGPRPERRAMTTAASERLTRSTTCRGLG
jgi:hypothetical protein